MRQTERSPFGPLLSIGPHAVGLASSGDADRHAGERGADHAEDVSVKVKDLNETYLAVSQEGYESAELQRRVAVIKAGQGKFPDLTKVEAVDLLAQHPRSVETGDMHPITVVLFQQAHQPHR